jgi:3-oxoacyl-(acyl-carrier-protein) synthase
MGLLTAVGNDLASSWKALLEGRSGVRRITRFDPEEFATQIAAEVKNFEPERWLEKKETRRQDLFTQFAVAAASMAVDDSGLGLA